MGNFLDIWTQLGGGGGRSRRLVLADDNERANFAFITDLNDGIARLIHFQGNRQFSCQGDQCPACAAGSKRRRLGFFWVYVYDILRPTQPKSGEAELVKVGNISLWREVVGEPRILQANRGLVEQMRGFFEINGTLLGQKFTLIRRGAARDLQTTYTLAATGGASVPEEALEDITPLEEAVSELVPYVTEDPNQGGGPGGSNVTNIASALEDL
jgi:hypothetical protein